MMKIDEMIDVLQAHKEGKIIQYTSGFLAGWLDLDEPSWNFRDVTYRIKPLPKPSINWEHVHPDYKWMASDSCGDTYLYNFEPTKGKTGWSDWGNFGIAETHASFVKGTCDWQDSLVERP